MSPSETSKREGLLEYPDEAFSYYRHEGVGRVICEQKHMGSRAVVIVCRDEASAIRRFGVVEEGIGICYTRTGRRFFTDRRLEADFLARVQKAISAANLWDEFKTDWICLDCELMPWAAKAQELLRLQYAPAGAAARSALPDAIAALETAAIHNREITPLVERYRQRLEMAEKMLRPTANTAGPFPHWMISALHPFTFLLLKVPCTARETTYGIWRRSRASVRMIRSFF